MLPLLDEAAERRQTSSRTNHNDRGLGFRGQAELRLADENRHLNLLAILGLLVLQVGGGHALVNATRGCFVLHQHGSHVDVGGMQFTRRRDRIITWLQTGQQLANMIDGRTARLDVLQNMDNVAAGILDPALVLFLTFMLKKNKGFK